MPTTVVPAVSASENEESTWLQLEDAEEKDARERQGIMSGRRHRQNPGSALVHEGLIQKKDASAQVPDISAVSLLKSR